MCEHEWQIGAMAVQDECHEGGDIMVFGGRPSEGEEGAVCMLCALIWGTSQHHDGIKYAITFLAAAHFPKNVTK